MNRLAFIQILCAYRNIELYKLLLRNYIACSNTSNKRELALVSKRRAASRACSIARSKSRNRSLTISSYLLLERRV
jgi:hypothetical protein